MPHLKKNKVTLLSSKMMCNKPSGLTTAHRVMKRRRVTLVSRVNIKRLTSPGSSETTRGAFLASSPFPVPNREDQSVMVLDDNTSKGNKGNNAYFQFVEWKQHLPQHKKLAGKRDYTFLEWFIGFSEGDGCFGIKNGRPYFAINQADLRLMQYIRSKLGFGRVSTFTQANRVYARYEVATPVGVGQLVALFNGNLHLAKTHQRFTRWVSFYNSHQNKKVVVKPRLAVSLISLQNGWLSGFFDAEGCCSASLVKDERMKLGVRLHVKACLDQKYEYDVLQQIGTLFGVCKVCVRNKEKEYYRVEMVSKQSLGLVMQYFTAYKLRGRKGASYAAWLKVARSFMSGAHLNGPVDLLEKRVQKIQSANQAFKRAKSVLTLLKEQIEKGL